VAIFLLCHMSQFQTIINNHNEWNGDQYFKKKIIFMSKFFQNATCYILIYMGDNQWDQIGHHGCNYNEVAQ
jgi:hypothetical protein